MVARQICPGRGHQAGHTAEQFQLGEEKVRGAVRQGALHAVGDAAVLGLLEALQRQRPPRPVPTQPLQALPVIGVQMGVGMEGEALQEGTARHLPGGRTHVQPRPAEALLAPRSSARTFFSGHSLLDNPLPDFVAGIAEAEGQSVHWNQQIVIGSPIRVRTWGSGDWSGYRQGKNRSGSDMDVVTELRSPRTLGAGERYDTRDFSSNTPSGDATNPGNPFVWPDPTPPRPAP
jgi:hypothetical protein